MNPLILDVETTTSNKGNPFDLTNKLIVVGVKNIYNQVLFYNQDYNNLRDLQVWINEHSLIVGFAIKFDLHWLRRIGIDTSKIKIWDCQIAEYLLSNQTIKYPSLDGAAHSYGLPPKLDIVKTEYWDKGIDTDKIPKDILSEYLAKDLVLTEQTYGIQLKRFQTTDKDKYALFRLCCADLLVLEEIEWNGIYFNTEKARARANSIVKEMEDIHKKLSICLGNIPFNPNSNDHISAILYGGVIEEVLRVPIGVYKTGEKVGQTKHKLLTKTYTLPRLAEPMKGSETAKSRKLSAGTGCGPTIWEVNETTLRSLKLNKAAKEVVQLLDSYGKLEKLRGTYLLGWSDLIDKMNWEHNTLHGTLNQCVAITGRLSSTKPNLQNADKETKKYCETRYK